MSGHREVALKQVTLTLCELCLGGVGGECHVPGCALYLSAAPDLPLTPPRPVGSVAHPS